jgi:GNAT superfamily N-acetyltransferase
MTENPEIQIRRAGIADASDVARLLHDFNTEFSAPTPGVEILTDRMRELLAANELTALLVGEPPYGISVLRFRPSLWAEALEVYLEELYVAPAQRGHGSGRALLEATLETARSSGAYRIELGTNETDTAAIALYQSCGFTNKEDGPDGPTMLYYERDL